jgi:hypothetical protein
MALAPVILNTNPHRPVDFKESAVQKAIDEAGSVSVEVKEDGCQLNMVVGYSSELGGYEVHFLSREGKAFNGLYELAQIMTRSGDSQERWKKFFEQDFNVHTGADLPTGMFPEGFMLQAEVLIGSKVCAEIAGDLRRGEMIPVSDLKFIAFDLVPLGAVESAGDYEVFQNVRRMHTEIQVNRLKEIFPEIHWELVVSGEAFDLVHLDVIYESYRRNKKEGAVAKDPLGYWKRGKRAGQWKVKPDDSCDGVVVGLMWGTPGLGNEGKVIGFRVLTEHGIEVDAGGLTEDQKTEYTKRVISYSRTFGEFPDDDRVREDLQGDTMNPFSRWAVKITYMERLPSGSYRHPNFDQFRGITDPMTKE